MPWSHVWLNGLLNEEIQENHKIAPRNARPGNLTLNVDQEAGSHFIYLSLSCGLALITRSHTPLDVLRSDLKEPGARLRSGYEPCETQD